MNLGEVPNAIFLLGVGTVFGVVFLNVLGSLQSTQTSGSLAYNATEKAMEGISNIFGQYGLVGTIMGFSIILGIVIALWYAMRGPTS